MLKVRKFRSSRYRPADLAIGSLHAEYQHRFAEPAVGEVVDFSSQGLALALDGEPSAPLLAGDVVSHLRVFRADTTFYRGTAVVRNVREDPGRTVVGLAFHDAWLDLRKLYDFDLRSDIAQRFGSFFDDRRRYDEIDPRFRAWVADVRFFLDDLRDRLRAEEERIRDLDAPTREAAARESVDLASAGAVAFLGERFTVFDELLAGLDDDQHTLYREYFQHFLLDAFVAESPFFDRCYRKPFGYAGDYEIMNMVYRDHRIGDTLYGQVLSVFGLGISAARAVANRIPFLVERIAAALDRDGGTRIASLACGPAREISELLDRYPQIEGAQVTLLDVEPRAIQYCERVLLPKLHELDRRVHIHFVRESIRQLIRPARLEQVLDPQDVVISIGLFDYFNDKMFARLVQRLYDLLRPSGHLFIGNFGHGNDSRNLMEYLMDWYLHHRDEQQLRALCAALPDDARVEVESEPLGINLFLHVHKPR